VEASNPIQRDLSWREALWIALAGMVAFQLAYTYASCSFLIAVYLWSLFQLTRLATSRHAFYFGLGVGFATCAPQAMFFWEIFGPAAIGLWCVLAFWIALFVSLGRLSRREFGPLVGVVLLPFLWTGLEYFRSELYFLRFSWLSPGLAFAKTLSWLPMRYVGVYGIAFVIMTGISMCSLLSRKPQIYTSLGLLLYLGILTNLTPPRILNASSLPSDLRVAGVQMEFPSELEALDGLNKLVQAFPQVRLLVLSECTFDGPVPEIVKNWCRKNQRYLIVGGKDAIDKTNYYNTAFVIGPDGTIIFKQAKCIPVQFFKDGLPATGQKLWNSPWGKLGICICYDLSYSRVTDELVRLGAQAIIVPTMDVVDWGRHQHELHARIAPTRAAEYGLPIFRLASSGISQAVNLDGRVLTTAPTPGEGAMLSTTLRLPGSGTIPPDRVMARICVGVTAAASVWFIFSCVRKRKISLENPNPL
jgi:apolipoprotein N-acyltransferase